MASNNSEDSSRQTASGRDLFFTPTASAGGESTSASSSSSSSSKMDGEQPPKSTYTYVPRKREERKYIDKEELNKPSITVDWTDGNLPHFSQIDATTDATNPVTGKSVYFGLYPWRCSDRATDWQQSMVNFDGPRIHLHHFRLLRKCSSSVLGEEPTDNYVRLPRSTALFYKERADAGMMRESFWERYPFEVRDVKKITEVDGVRMRTWRQQRHIEEVAKRDQIDDLIKSSVLPSQKGRIERIDELSNPYTKGT